MTEVKASTGAFVASIAGPTFKFDRPTAIQFAGGDLFVANGSGNSVTEFNPSNGSLVRVISKAKFDFSDPIALAANYEHLYVLNSSGSVTEVALSTGYFTKNVSGSPFGFSSPTSITRAGNDLFVTNSGDNSVTELTKSLSHVKTLSGSSYKFRQPVGGAYDGTDLWFSNYSGESITEVAPTTGNVVQVVVNSWLPTPGPITVGDGYIYSASPPGSSPMISQVTPGDGSVNWMMCNTNGPYAFNNPQALAVAGSTLWVVNEGGNSLTEMNATTGAFVATIS